MDEDKNKIEDKREGRHDEHTPIMRAAMKYKGSITINDPAFYL